MHSGNMKHACAIEFDHTNFTCYVISKIDTLKKKGKINNFVLFIYFFSFLNKTMKNES